MTRQDNRCVAAVAMNMSTICNTALMATFKHIAKEGFSAIDYNVCRNVVGAIICFVMGNSQGYNPIMKFPFSKKWYMLGRCLSGQANFVLVNIAVTLAPISMVLVLW